MESIQKAIQDKLGDVLLGNLGKKFGIDLSKSNSIVKMALPLILGALAKNVTNKSEASGLSKALDDKHDGSILDHLDDVVADDAIRADGSKILGHVFGDKKANVTKMLSESAEVDADAAEGMLDSLAPVVLGEIGKAKKEQSLDESSLSDLLQGEGKEAKKELGGIMNLLDRDNDGSVMDDLLDLGKGFLK